MEISPILHFYLLLSSLIFGMALGVVNDINRLIRVVFGVRYSDRDFNKMYMLKLPFLKNANIRLGDHCVKKRILHIVIFFQDIFLFIISAFGVVILNYYYNNGTFRIYTLIMLFVGFLIYYFTIGKVVMLLSEVIVFFIRVLISAIAFSIAYPICKIICFFRKNVKKIIKKIQKSIANKRKKEYNKNKIRKILDFSDNGFIDI